MLVLQSWPERPQGNGLPCTPTDHISQGPRLDLNFRKLTLSTPPLAQMLPEVGKSPKDLCSGSGDIGFPCNTKSTGGVAFPEP